MLVFNFRTLVYFENVKKKEQEQDEFQPWRGGMKPASKG